MSKPTKLRQSGPEVPEWTELNEAALALYKLDHPTYESDTFEEVPLLATVTTYRHRAWIVIQAVERFRANHADRSGG